jgi:hypothetical protein
LINAKMAQRKVFMETRASTTRDVRGAVADVE